MSDPTSTLPEPPPLRLREKDLHWRAVEGEIVALDMSSSEYLSVNGSGALLWDALSNGTTQPALVALLTERFDLAADVAQRDVDAFLTALRTQRLLDEPTDGDG